jgi:hypothetical protein
VSQKSTNNLGSSKGFSQATDSNMRETAYSKNSGSQGMNQSGGRWFSMKRSMNAGHSSKRSQNKEGPIVAQHDLQPETQKLESPPFTMAGLLRKKKK